MKPPKPPGKRSRKTLKRSCDTDSRHNRRCVATGKTGGRDQFIRFVRSQDGLVFPDFTGRLPGRGAWVSAERCALNAAIERGAFSHAFKSDTKVPDDLADLVDNGLVAAGLSAIGLARKVGDVVLGFDAISRQLANKSSVSVLIIGNDASVDGRRKLVGAVNGDVAIIDIFNIDQISAAVGGGNVVYAGIKSGNSAARFIKLSRRLAEYRNGSNVKD